MEQSFFSDAIGSLNALIEEYQHLDATKDRLIPDALRLSIVSWGLLKKDLWIYVLKSTNV